jgi:hypothetical protein
MGVEYNKLEEECESRKESHKRGICRGWDDSWIKEERELGVDVAIEGEL